jgi:hypothetical protein
MPLLRVAALLLPIPLTLLPASALDAARTRVDSPDGEITFVLSTAAAEEKP